MTKRSLIVAGLGLLLLAVPAPNAEAQVGCQHNCWFSAGVITDPATGAVLADTGQLQPENRRFKIVLSTSVQGAVRLEWRNAANNGTILAHTFPMAAFSTVTIPWDAGIQLGTNERIRVVMNAGVTGLVQASLLVD